MKQPGAPATRLHECGSWAPRGVQWSIARTGLLVSIIPMERQWHSHTMERQSKRGELVPRRKIVRQSASLVIRPCCVSIAASGKQVCPNTIVGQVGRISRSSSDNSHSAGSPALHPQRGTSECPADRAYRVVFLTCIRSNNIMT